jgi:hypothetical protein
VGKNPPKVDHKRYYIREGDNSWKDYTGSLPAEVDLYERYSTLTIPADSVDAPI